MKEKNEKRLRPLRSGNADLDGQAGYLAVNGGSWLAGTLGLNEDIYRSQRRAIASQVFLQTRLCAWVEARQFINESTVVDLLVDFKRTRRDLETEFEMAHVIGRLLSRFQCHLLDNTPPDPSDVLEREIQLFESLAGLNFQTIDEAVRKRLHSG